MGGHITIRDNSGSIIGTFHLGGAFGTSYQFFRNGEVFNVDFQPGYPQVASTQNVNVLGVDRLATSIDLLCTRLLDLIQHQQSEVEYWRIRAMELEAQAKEVAEAA